MIHIVDFTADWDKNESSMPASLPVQETRRPGRRFNLFYVSHNIQILVLTVGCRVRSGTGSILSFDRKKQN